MVKTQEGNQIPSIYDRRHKNKQALQQNNAAIRGLMRKIEGMPKGSKERLEELESLSKMHDVSLKLQSAQEVYTCSHKWDLVGHANDGDEVKCGNCSWTWFLPCLRTLISSSVWGPGEVA